MHACLSAVCIETLVICRTLSHACLNASKDSWGWGGKVAWAFVVEHPSGTVVSLSCLATMLKQASVVVLYIHVSEDLIVAALAAGGLCNFIAVCDLISVLCCSHCV